LQDQGQARLTLRHHFLENSYGIRISGR